MKAIRLLKPNLISNHPLVISDCPIPSPAEDEIIVKIDYCGLCRTDLHIIEGDLPTKKLPLTPGHQIVGKIEIIGKKIKNCKIGDNVGIPWLYSTCGKCEYCLSQKENLCDNARFTGYHVDGGFAEYIKIPADYVYQIPEKFSNEKAAPLLCGGVIGFRALKLCNIKPGGRLGLFGFGSSAHILIQVARFWGCEVYVFSRNSDHRKFAEELGAVWTGTSEMIPPHLLNSVIIFAPNGELVPMALNILTKGGTIVLAGIYSSPIPQFRYELLYNEKKIISVTNSTREDVHTFLDLALEVDIKTQTELFSLREANYALNLLKDSKITGTGVLKID